MASKYEVLTCLSIIAKQLKCKTRCKTTKCKTMHGRAGGVTQKNGL